MTDDAYFGLRYEDSAMKESLFARLCNRHERMLAVKLDGATKEMFVWGVAGGIHHLQHRREWRSRSPFYDALERKTAGDIRGSISNASHLSQSIVLRAMLHPEELEKERKTNVAILKNRANKIKEILDNPKFGRCLGHVPVQLRVFHVPEAQDGGCGGASSASAGQV